MKKQFGVNVDFERAKRMLEAGDGAGNTFKASAKPVLIGTAVVGATTLIFATIMALTDSLTTNVDKLSILHAPFLLGLITGGAVIYWFVGAATQAVTTGAYRAVEFIKRNMKIEGADESLHRRQQEGSGHLHPLRAKRDADHLHLAVFCGAGFRLPRSFLLHRLSDLDCDLRALPGHLHGQRGRSLG